MPLLTRDTPAFRPIRWPLSMALFFWIPVLSCGLQNAHAQVLLSKLEQEAQSAFNPTSKAVHAIKMQGAISWTQGALKESGTVTLTASADGATSEEWRLDSLTHSSTATAFNAGRICTNTDAKANKHADESVGCLRALPWFSPGMEFPLLSGMLLDRTDVVSPSAPAATSASATYVSKLAMVESKLAKGIDVFTAGTAARVSFDPITFLATQIDFDIPIDSELSHITPCRVVYSDYRLDGGLMLPHRVRRYIHRTLQADITISNVTVE